MISRPRFRLASTLGLLLLGAAPALAQSGAVTGSVTDAETGNALPGANVVVAGTSMGAATDFEGRYQISGVPAGEQRLVATYLGYEADTLAVTIPAGGRAGLDIALRPAVVRGETVEVTAQLEGQLAAINEQRSSNTIVNVVSSDRIREYPDANAAESVGRLPGVSLQRDGGEGTKVQVRGLDPSFTSVTINGERIPGSGEGGFDDAGSRGGGRSVDLSLISSDLLAGVELFKALTPDKDADAIGGTVNLVVREAPTGLRGRVRALGGYSDLEGSVENLRLDGNVSNRFLGDRLGVVATANFQQTPRGYEGFQADFNPRTLVEIETRSLEVDRREEVRTRYGASLTTDYRLPGGGVQLRGLYSRSERDQDRLRIRYRIEETDAERAVRTQLRTDDLVSGGLSGEHAFPRLRVDYSLSASQSLGRTPEGWDARFRQTTAFEGLASTDFADASREQIADSAGAALDETFFRSIRRVRERTRDRDLTAALNLAAPFRLADALAVELRAGGKFRGKRRTQDYSRDEVISSDIERYAEENDLPLLDGTTDPAAFPYFLDDEGDAADGLSLLETPDRDAIATLDADLDPFYESHPFFDQRDYEADEDIAAGYALAEVNAGPLLVVGGVRYERTSTGFSGTTGTYTSDLQRLLNSFEDAQMANPDTTFAEFFSVRDTTGAQDYGAWFPQVTARYRVTDFLDVRAAVTRTLARPDYVDLVAYENVDEINNEIERGNTDLQPTFAWNYDAGVSAYTRYGLFAVGGFYKRLAGFQYDQFFDEFIEDEGRTFRIFQTVNGEAATVWGVELEAQANFLFLPGVLSGFLLNANYAWTQSEAEFPIQYGIGFDAETFRTVFASETRTDALPGQAEHVANLTLGYERGGFSGRLSLSYQGAFLVSVTESVFDGAFVNFGADDPETPDLLEWAFDDPETEEIEGGPITQAEVRTGLRTRPYTFIDLQLSQDIPGVKGLRVIANASNLTDQFERQRLGARNSFGRGYGWSGEFGVQYKF
ncbi:MAG: TonB-dependent receptor [Bacteroidota bacterium]